MELQLQDNNIQYLTFASSGDTGFGDLSASTYHICLQVIQLTD